MLLLSNQDHDSFELLSLIGRNSAYRVAFVIFLFEGAKLQTRLFAAVVPVWLVQESFRHWTKTITFSNITLVRTDLGH